MWFTTNWTKIQFQVKSEPELSAALWMNCETFSSVFSVVASLNPIHRVTPLSGDLSGGPRAQVKGSCSDKVCVMKTDHTVYQSCCSVWRFKDTKCTWYSDTHTHTHHETNNMFTYETFNTSNTLQKDHSTISETCFNLILQEELKQSSWLWECVCTGYVTQINLIPVSRPLCIITAVSFNCEVCVFNSDSADHQNLTYNE